MLTFTGVPLTLEKGPFTVSVDLTELELSCRLAGATFWLVFVPLPANVLPESFCFALLPRRVMLTLSYRCDGTRPWTGAPHAQVVHMRRREREQWFASAINAAVARPQQRCCVRGPSS